MSLFQWTKKSPDVLQQGGVIAPDERLPWPQTAVMGVQPGTISRWENARRLRDEKAARYREALATFGTIPTVSVTQPDAAA